MIQHVWTVLCERTMVDHDTNNIVLHVIEQLGLSGPLPIAEGSRVVIPLNLRVISLWTRTTDDLEEGQARLRVLDPNGNQVIEAQLELAVAVKRLRTITEIASLPLAASGEYRFVVALRSEDGSWPDVASVPLEVNIPAE